MRCLRYVLGRSLGLSILHALGLMLCGGMVTDCEKDLDVKGLELQVVQGKVQGEERVFQLKFINKGPEEIHTKDYRVGLRVVEAKEEKKEKRLLLQDNRRDKVSLQYWYNNSYTVIEEGKTPQLSLTNTLPAVGVQSGQYVDATLQLRADVPLSYVQVEVVLLDQRTSKRVSSRKLEWRGKKHDLARMDQNVSIGFPQNGECIHLMHDKVYREDGTWFWSWSLNFVCVIQNKEKFPVNLSEVEVGYGMQEPLRDIDVALARRKNKKVKKEEILPEFFCTTIPAHSGGEEDFWLPPGGEHKVLVVEEYDAPTHKRVGGAKGLWKNTLDILGMEAVGGLMLRPVEEIQTAFMERFTGAVRVSLLLRRKSQEPLDEHAPFQVEEDLPIVLQRKGK